MFDSLKGLKRFKQVLTLRQWPWAMLQFSTSVEVRPGNVRPCVCPCVTKSYREPRLRFLSFFAQMFLTIRLRNVHGRLSGKNLDHSKINDVGPKKPF